MWHGVMHDVLMIEAEPVKLQEYTLPRWFGTRELLEIVNPIGLRGASLEPDVAGCDLGSRGSLSDTQSAISFDVCGKYITNVGYIRRLLLVATGTSLTPKLPVWLAKI